MTNNTTDLKLWMRKATVGSSSLPDDTTAQPDLILPDDVPVVSRLRLYLRGGS